MKRTLKFKFFAILCAITMIVLSVASSAYVTKYGLKVGDVDESETVDEIDYVYLARYLAGWDIAIDLDAADIDFDGDVDEQDAAMFARKNAGWNVASEKEKLAEVFNNQVFCFVGDSITCGVGATMPSNRFSTKVAKRMEAFEQNIAISGSVICTGGDYISDMVNFGQIKSADVIIVAMGVNDFNASMTKEMYGPGEKGLEEKDSTTFYGALETACEFFTEFKNTKKPNLRVIFLTPLISSPEACTGGPYTYDNDAKNMFGCTRRDYCDIILDVAGDYGFEAIDTNRVAGSYYNSPEDETVSKYLNDGLHPNDAGYDKIADVIISYLLGELPNDAK